jgi:hypothetical protein
MASFKDNVYKDIADGEILIGESVEVIGRIYKKIVGV